DFFSLEMLGATRYCAGFRYVTMPASAAFLGEARIDVEVLDAPIDRSAVELLAVEAHDTVRLQLALDPAAIDPRLGPLLASWLDLELGGGQDLPRLSRLQGKSRRVAANVVQLVDDQAARTPDGLAACDERDRLTYADLLDAAAGVAEALTAHGVDEGHAVAV